MRNWINLVENALTEMPVRVTNINVPHPDEDVTSSFTDDDRKILHSDKARMKLDRVWKSSIVDVNLYTFDAEMSPDRALGNALNNYDPYSPEYREARDLKKRLDTARSKIVLSPDTISVLLTNNYGGP